MKKVLIIITILSLLFLAACGNDATGKRVGVPKMESPTGAAVGVKAEEPAAILPAPVQEESTQTAAEALEELKENPAAVTEPSSKRGNFYPPVVVKGTYEEALKEKTRALFQKDVPEVTVDADRTFGPRYANGLPGEYGQSSPDY